MAAFYWLVIDVTSLSSGAAPVARHLVILAFGVANLTLPCVIVALHWLRSGASHLTLVNVLRLVKFVGIFVLLAAVAVRVGQAERLGAVSASLYAAVAVLDLISVWLLLSFLPRSAAPPGSDAEAHR